MLSMRKKRAAAALLSLCLLAGLVLPARAGAADADALQPDPPVFEAEPPSVEETEPSEILEVPEATENPAPVIEPGVAEETEDGSDITAFEMADQYIDCDLIDTLAAVAAEAEPNDTLNAANRINVNTQVSGSISKSSDVDWYAFTIPSDGYISLTFDHGFVDRSSNCWSAAFYTSGNKELNSWGFQGNSTEAVTTNKIGIPAGTYYIRVADSAYWNSADYHFQVNYTSSNEWEKEFNETLTAANKIAPNTDVYGSIRTSSDEDWYAVTIPSDGYISLTFDHGFVDSSSKYWSAAFYTSGNKELNSWSFPGNSTEAAATNNIGIPAGTYYIRIADSAYWSSADYHFQVNYTSSNEWEKEFNETLTAANKIAPNTDVYGSIRTSSDEDWYAFTIPSDGYISLTFDHGFVDSSSKYWSAAFYTSGNKELNSWSFPGNSTEAAATNNIGIPAGTYYIRIADSAYWNSADYHFQVNYTSSNEWEKEFNETLTAANKIAPNTDVYGSIRTSSDEDWYAFTIPSDGYISLTFDHGFVDSSSKYWSAAFYTSGNKELNSWSFPGNSTEAAATNNIGIPAGTYYIRVADSAYRSSADYHFQVNYIPSDEWEKEFNETLTAANKIVPNTDVYGSIRTSSDEDWYVFTIPRDGEISLTFDHGFVDSSSNYWSTAFYTSGNASIQSWRWKGNDRGAATTDKISVTAGTYYLRVTDSAYSSAVDYHFKVNCAIALTPIPVSSKGGFAEVAASSDGMSTVVTVDNTTLAGITPAAGGPLVFVARGSKGAVSGTVNTATGEITFQTVLSAGDKILFLHPGTYSPLIRPIILG